MRKLLVLLVIVIFAAVVWMWRGRDLTLLSERCGTVAIRSEPVKTLVYDGSGKGGMLRVNNLELDVTPAKSSDRVPEIGTSKDGQVALSYAGKVFNFGPPSGSDDHLTTQPAAGDEATIEIRRSYIAWPNPFGMNFMTGKSPSWKRFRYQRLIWKKSDGAKLEMTWRCEQYFYASDRWTDACMTDPGITGLIRIEISKGPQ